MRRFREQVLPHLDAAYNFARYLARDPVLAEDIVQDAFLNAVRAFPGYRGGQPKAWLFAIVRNGFLSSARQASRTSARLVSGASDELVVNLPDHDQISAELDLEQRQDAAAIRTVIDALPDPFRETIILRELEDMTYRDISSLTGAPVGTVMSRLARGRRILADMLAPIQAERTGALQTGVVQREQKP